MTAPLKTITRRGTIGVNFEVLTARLATNPKPVDLIVDQHIRNTSVATRATLNRHMFGRYGLKISATNKGTYTNSQRAQAKRDGIQLGKNRKMADRLRVTLVGVREDATAKQIEALTALVGADVVAGLPVVPAEIRGIAAVGR